MIAYRPDIDGLRALAVLAVIIFHTFPSMLQGGYSGVDIFFVISGFLITKIIAQEMEEKNFSLLKFYERRAKRILPALFTVMGISFIFAHLFLLPAEYEGFGKSLAATAIFGSNFLFLSEAGYFDITGNLKPLLHTWSLGIEEQFYIFFPLYLMFVFRFCRKVLLPLTIAGAALSFAISVWGVSTGREESVFFLLPTRAWELLIGSLLALRVFPALRFGFRMNILGFIGFCFIVYGAVRDVPLDQYPGANALFPTLGAGLLIYAGLSPMQNYVTRLLSLPALVSLGKMSYSLYLWHWPALVFAEYIHVTPLPLVLKLSLLAIIFILSYASWRFIEIPCRKMEFSTPHSRHMFFYSILISMCVFLGIGLWIYAASGMPSRYEQKVLNYAQVEKGGTFPAAGITNIPTTNELIGAKESLEKVSFIVWGDSHATALSPALDNAGQAAGKTGLFVKEAACFPAFDVSAPVLDFCKKFDTAVQAYITEHENIRDVYLIARWSAYPRWWSNSEKPEGNEKSCALFYSELLRTIKALQSQKKRVIIVTEAPYIDGWYVPSVLARNAYLGYGMDIRVSRAQHLKQQETVLKIFNDLKNQTGVILIHPHDVLCDSQICAVEKDGKSLYFDDDHLSTFGAQTTLNLFENILKP